MEKINKVYNVSIYEYYGNIASNNDCCARTKIIDTNDYCYSLEEAIKVGKRELKNYCYNEIYKHMDDDDELPDELSNEEFESFINKRLNDNFSYSIIVSIISGNRLIFNTAKELMEYFNNNIKDISNEDLYDFLLSMVIKDDQFYDYKGDYINHFIWKQMPKLDGIFDATIEFNEKDCIKGIYKFNYRIF